MGMAAPKGTQAPAAGLAAIAQPAQAPKGMSSGSMAQVMAMARKMSDGQLAEVLQGKSLSVPQYVAMTEAMGRKSLRTAMDGQQAMAQAKQPSIKDKLLMGDQPQMQGIQQGMPQMPQQPVMAASGGLMYADGGAIDMNEGQAAGGLAELPAPNMEGLTLAGGGIVAFRDNPDQPVREGMPPTELTEEEQRKQLAENPYMKRVQAVGEFGGQLKNAFTDPRNYNPIDLYQRYIGQPFSRFANQSPREQKVAFDKASEARTGERGTFTSAPADVARDKEKTAVARKEDAIDVADKTRKDRMKQVGLNAIDLEEARAGAGMRALAEAQQRQAKPADVPAGTDQRSNDRRAALAGTDTGTGITPEKRANPFGALKADLPDYVKIKNQGLGEGLMTLSGALFGNPNMAMAMSQGLPALAKISGATRKEVAEVKKDYNAQQLNLAKANELFEQGQEDKAFKYLKQSQDHAYHMKSVMASMAAVNKPAAELQVLRALQNPGETLSDTYARTRTMQQDPKQDQFLRGKHADYMKSAIGMVNPLKFDEWLKQSGYGAGSATMASNTGSFNTVYDTNNQQIK
jgi:hypothetical protein